jgi:hypothetical protein
MPLLLIEHSVSDFDGWKRAFDADPLGRKASGVRRYQVHRAVADPNYVFVDLDFATVAEAERMHERLKQLWEGPGGAVTRGPSARIVETVETRTP